MNIKEFDEIHLANSTLKVTASETVDISEDLESTELKSIAELIDDKKQQEIEKK